MKYIYEFQYTAICFEFYEEKTAEYEIDNHPLTAEKLLEIQDWFKQPEDDYVIITGFRLIDQIKEPSK